MYTAGHFIGWCRSTLCILGKGRLGNVLAWLERVRARPGVAAGIAWGMQDEAEMDKWSQETRAKYMAMGGKIATAHGKSKL